MAGSPTREDLDRRQAAKRAGGHPPPARQHELADGEAIAGTVLRLPGWCIDSGTWLFLRTADGDVCIPASAGRGHSVLERLLGEQQVQVADRIRVTYRGKRRTADGEREYRDYTLELDRG